jgi:hypothetical protein
MSQDTSKLQQIWAETAEAPAAGPAASSPGVAPAFNPQSYANLIQSLSTMASTMAALSGNGVPATGPVGAAVSSVGAIQSVNALLMALSGIATSDPKQAQATLDAISAAHAAASAASPAGAPAPAGAQLFDTMSQFAQQMNTFSATATRETSSAVNMFSQLAQALTAASSPAGAPSPGDISGLAKTLSDLTTRLTADSLPSWARENFVKGNEKDRAAHAPSPH